MSLNKLIIATAAATLMTGTALAGIGNGKGVNNGNKNGWEDSGGGYEGNVPKGLNVSGDNGRIDNGKGNGGENPNGNTPNKNGETGGGDADPNG
ncbi:hypothetical protein FQ775_02245 [Nitratireductor mangrovi]|uniref:Uncharacterized protein n=1 Tax=Nitratireductor mangrovi TaxID=2599600 RepID=A0A5B8KUL0_9HYPH|nr:hypothetical protein [Nitratireductor mangrovi]QDY99284.1 hypothetical protein FQ775_02245 [Nitratireductor mangrovi]